MHTIPPKFLHIHTFLRKLSPTFYCYLPLKQGILDDITNNDRFKERGFSLFLLRSYFRFYTNDEYYLKNLLNKNARYNLGGHIDGEITDEQRRFAKAKLEKIYSISKVPPAQSTLSSVDKMGRPILSIKKRRSIHKDLSTQNQSAA